MSYCHNTSTTTGTSTDAISSNLLLPKQSKRELWNPKRKEKQKEKALSTTTTTTTTTDAVSCSDILSHPYSPAWPDPNQGGQSFLRRMVQRPHFAISTHSEEYDPVRWKYLFKEGRYYETLVFDRFQRILRRIVPPPNTTSIVVDVGANIGYYTLLSAALGHPVLAFEINPANIRRLCESLRFNQFDLGDQVTIYQRGVSDSTGQRLQVIVPKNPGQAFMKAEETTDEDKDNKEKKNEQHDSNIDAHHAWTTTLTLDDFAQQQGWLLPDANVEISILKLDVEGKEPNIIQGATKLLHAGKVRNVLTELRRLSRPNVQAALAVLLDAGYTLIDEKRARDQGHQPDAAQTKQILEELKVSMKGSQKNIDLWFTRDPPTMYSL